MALVARPRVYELCTSDAWSLIFVIYEAGRGFWGLILPLRQPSLQVKSGFKDTVASDVLLKAF